MLLAKRNNNIKAEQKAYEKIIDFCDSKGYDFDNVVQGVKKYMKEETIAPAMNGVI